jgi:AAA domain
MSLRGVKPKALKKRLKLFIYGAAKIGKTTAAIQFPKPYWIDTESCADKTKYADLIEKSDGLVFQSLDFDEMVKEVKYLMSTKHEFKTLIIDSFTNLYNDLVDKAGIKFGTDFGRHYNEANKKVKHLLNLLLRIDLNIVLTAHSKNEYGQNMSVLGQTFDCYKKLDYLFDLIIEVQRRGKERIAIVKGTRLEGFTEDEIFPLSYDEIAKRYGHEVMERESVVENLASADQIAHLKYLIELYREPEETISKWLEKATCESFEEMNEEIILKLIKFMESKSKGVAA